MGGVAWSTSMGVGLVSCFAATHIYFSAVDEPAWVIDKPVAWRLVVSLAGAWLAIFLLFLYGMVPKYRRTFFSMQTGRSWVQDRFLDASNPDDYRARVQFHSARLWNEIRPDVRRWFAENWDRWEEEEPEWFTDLWKAKCKNDLVPEAVRASQAFSERVMPLRAGLEEGGG
jgi:hypothetical protein